MHYLWWVPCIIIYYTIMAWMTKQNNDLGGTWPWSWKLYVYGALCPWWVLVSCVSKNIIFEALLNDIILALTFTITFYFLGAGEEFSIRNWVGVAVVIIGFVLVKS